MRTATLPVSPNDSHGANGNGKLVASHPTPPVAAGPDRSTITARLLETVRDRTGYPIETLGLDLDMEADLGIDSIKRVEILGKLRDLAQAGERLSVRLRPDGRVDAEPARSA